MDNQHTPDWLSPGGNLDEVAFADFFLNYRKMVCIDGAFFTRDGRVWDENALRKEIYIFLSDYIRSGITGKVERILDGMRMAGYRDQLPLQEDVIHTNNGTLYLDKDFVPEKEFCRHRLPVAYNPLAAPPERWLRFLRELLEEEDILTLQEYMGYCLVPTTRAQKMLLITGRGGEGKSRIGVVMKSLLGCNMSVGSIAKLESSPFARADLQHLLLMVDDDLKMEALTQTNHIKSIITAELPMDLERKGIQSYQALLRCRLLAFGNGNLQALYDRSMGFFRRQIILTTKPKDPGRRDDPYLADKLLEEKEGIFLWCLEGLQRLRSNDFRFTLSRIARQNLWDSITEGNNVLSFLKSHGYFILDPEGMCASRHLYSIYRDWCEDNSFPSLNPKSFFTAFREAGVPIGLVPTNHVAIGNGKEARGFRGIRSCPRF